MSGSNDASADSQWVLNRLGKDSGERSCGEKKSMERKQCGYEMNNCSAPQTIGPAESPRRPGAGPKHSRF